MDGPTGPERKGTLTYALPDWAALDTVWKRSQPFVLWKIGEQPLLFHWLDAAVNAGVERVVLYAADRPAEIRRAMEEATLWPIEWELRPVAQPLAQNADAVADHVPGLAAPEKPEDGWGLIRYWHRLEQDWLERFARETRGDPLNLGVGLGCWIHPTAQLVSPYWLADRVFVGPRCQVGPGAVLGEGSMVDEGARIERAHLFDRTYLGPESDLTDSILQGGTLLNLKHGARVDRLEHFIAAGPGEPLRSQARRVPLTERWLAMRLWWHWRGVKVPTAETFEGLDGQSWTLPPEGGAASRRCLLPGVWQGRLSLFGPTPRSKVIPEDVPDEWVTILKNASPGVFSYADVMEAAPGSFEDWLHSVYQAQDPGEQTEELCRAWAKALLRSG